MGQQRLLAVAVDRIDELLDRLGGDVPGRHLDRGRVVQQGARTGSGCRRRTSPRTAGSGACGGSSARILRMSGRKPMSSIRSASSRTRISTCDRLTLFWPTWSSRRPGRRDQDLHAAAQGLGLRLDRARRRRRPWSAAARCGRRSGSSRRPASPARASGPASGRGPDGGPARSWCWRACAGGRGWAARRRRSCRCRSARRRAGRGPGGRVGWRRSGRASGPCSPLRRRSGRGRPRGRGYRRSRWLLIGPARSRESGRDAVLDRPEHSRNR